MPAITAPGLGSGLDVGGIVTKLMELERRPIEALDKKEAIYNARISGYGQLKSALSTFQTTMDNLGSVDKFQAYSTASSNENILTATATSAAGVGGHAVNVTALAQNHKLVSGAFADATTSQGLTGALTISVGTVSPTNPAFVVNVDATNDSLVGIRDAINNAADNSGVTASVINVTGGSHLVLTSDDAGLANAVDIGGLAPLTYTSGGGANTFTELSAAQDAAFTVDGFAATSTTNTVEGVADGLTLNLTGVGAANITLSRNTTAVETSVQEFVDAYNDLTATIKSQKEGLLDGENMLLSISSSLRDVFNTEALATDPANPTGPGIKVGTYSYLAEVGVSFDRYGQLALDSTKLSTALTSDFRSLAQLFTHAEGGFATRLTGAVDQILEPPTNPADPTNPVFSKSLLDNKIDGFNDLIEGIGTSREQLERRMEITQARLFSKFSALDGLVSNMNATSSFLSQQLANMPNFNSKN